MAQIVDTLKWILEADMSGFSGQLGAADRAAAQTANTIGNKLAGAVKGLIAAYVGMQGIDLAKQLFMEGAAAQRVEDSYKRLTAAVHANADVLTNEMKAAVNNTIDDSDLMLMANRALIKQIDAEYIPQFMKLAYVLSKATGESTESVFETIQAAIARGMDKSLKQLGLKVDFTNKVTEAEKALARAMSDTEKSQFLATLIIDAGNVKMKEFGGIVTDNVDKVNQLGAAVRGLREEFGKGMTEGAGVSGTAKFLNIVAALIKTQREFIRIAMGGKSDEQTGGIGSELFNLAQPLAEIKKYAEVTKRELQEIYYKLGQYTTEQMIAYYEKEIKLAEDNSDEKKAIENRLHQLRLDNAEKEADWEINGKKRVLDSGGWGGMRGGAGSTGYIVGSNAVPQISTSALGSFGDEFWKQMAEMFYPTPTFYDNVDIQAQKMKDVVSGIFEGIFNNLNSELQMMGNMLIQAASGNIAGSIAGFVDAIFGIFQDEADYKARKQQEYADALQRVADETERAIEAQTRMTDLEIADRKALLETLIAGHQAWMAAYPDSSEYQIEAAELAGFIEELNALMGNIGGIDAVRGIASMADLVAFITGQGTAMTYQGGKSIIDHFVEMLGLTTDQQIELYELLRETLLATGNLTTDQLFSLDEIIKNLQEAAIAGVESAQTQINRSVTTITEAQANIISAILNTISAQIREILDVLRQMLAGMRNGIGGGIQVNIYGNITGGNANEIGNAVAQSISVSMRAYGVRTG